MITFFQPWGQREFAPRVLMSQLGGRITENDEKANIRCREAITIQKQAILTHLRTRTAPPP